ncbi:LytTR family transcriptional regulator [Allocoprobacillus halotolerans]|uniref:LytTR family transcriptional regulator n=1 Tax=Allocoprobacillus halotolerans TaxID=2944914 RepID=A0ABY5I7R4_9FIRM|nr:LytTR family DNA-binding domain-containing protein [Allocoprobacillus halotolerans]UTY40078.1 LytTR family transcriptional regulator [Allocoprobacillus halotolerans]
MKIKIEIDERLEDEEVVIKTPCMNEKIQHIQEVLRDISKSQTAIVFYKGTVEYYLSLNDILFFETDGKEIHGHTCDDMYKIKYKLYELEEILPGRFMRVSKSTILNIQKIYALHKTISSPCLVEFEHTHKQVYISRHYYKPLRSRLEEKRL